MIEGHPEERRQEGQFFNDAFRKGRTPIEATMDVSSLALEASKVGLSPIIRSWWHRGMGLQERHLKEGMWHRDVTVVRLATVGLGFRP